MKHAIKLILLKNLTIIAFISFVAIPSVSFAYEVKKNEFGYFISQVDISKIMQVYPVWADYRNLVDNVSAFLLTDPYEFGRDNTRLVAEQIQNHPGQLYCVDESTKHPITQDTKPGAFGTGLTTDCAVTVAIDPLPIEGFDCVFWRDQIANMFIGDYHACYVQLQMDDAIIVVSIYLPKLPEFDKFYSMDIISVSGSTRPYFRYLPDIGSGVVLENLSHVELLAETPVSFKGMTIRGSVPAAIDGTYIYDRPNQRYNDIYASNLFVVE